MSAIEALTALAREFGRHDVLAVCREILPASDYDAIESRLREQRVNAGVPSRVSASPAAPVAAAAFNSGESRATG